MPKRIPSAQARSSATRRSPQPADGPQRRGRSAEALAASHLESCGVRLLARNYRCRGGELDLVGVDGDLLLFIEVRQRTSFDFGGALASIDARKRRRLRRAADCFRLRQPEWRGHRARFDVIALEGAARPAAAPVWIRGAFT